MEPLPGARRILAARFPTADAARSALEALRGSLGPDADDADLRPPGRSVLSATVPGDRADGVRALFARHGGELELDADEPGPQE